MRRRWPVIWALLLLDLAAAPGVYQLWRDARGDAANAAPLACAGDCDHDYVVGIGELLTGVAIALADVSLETCDAFDVVPGGGVTVDELVRAVLDSRGLCRLRTPTLIPTESTPFTPRVRARATPPPP